MTTQTIPYNQLEKAVRISFENDKDMFKLYDKSVIVTNLEELIVDVMLKIKEYSITYPDTEFKAVYEKNKVIGYIVFKEETLISFALAIEYRQRKYLNEFFSLIKRELRGHFCCTLWSRNVRAVKWLLGMGLRIYDTNPHVTILIK